MARPGKARWVTGLLETISGFSLFQLPGRDGDCAAAIRRALAAMRDLGDEMGVAYCLEALGWLAARDSRSDQAAWLLGAADALWRRASCQLGNLAVLEQSHERAAKQAREALGGLRYENAHDRGAGPISPRSSRRRWTRAARRGGRTASTGHAVTPTRSRAPRETRPATTAARASPQSRSPRSPGASGSRAPGGKRLFDRDIAIRLSHLQADRRRAHGAYLAELEISSRVKLAMWLQFQVRMGA